LLGSNFIEKEKLFLNTMQKISPETSLPLVKNR